MQKIVMKTTLPEATKAAYFQYLYHNLSCFPNDFENILRTAKNNVFEYQEKNSIKSSTILFDILKEVDNILISYEKPLFCKNLRYMLSNFMPKLAIDYENKDFTHFSDNTLNYFNIKISKNIADFDFTSTDDEKAEKETEEEAKERRRYYNKVEINAWLELNRVMKPWLRNIWIVKTRNLGNEDVDNDFDFKAEYVLQFNIRKKPWCRISNIGLAGAGMV